MNTTTRTRLLFAALLALGLAARATAQTAPAFTPAAGSSAESDAELVKKLNNPVASLISVPLQNNFDYGAGPTGDGFQYKLNLQPVYPAELGEDLSLITRVILPYVYQEDVIANGTSQSGLGDTNASFFFAPKTAPGKPIWGVGPAIIVPTATDDVLGTEKWSAGPTGLILRQEGPLTCGLLASHVWSFAGSGSRADINQTFLQPFFAYATPRHTTFALNTEAAYDWTGEQWTVPVNVMVSQLVRIGKMPVSFQLGYRYYAEKPAGGPDWGLRFGITFVFPAPGSHP